MSNQKISTKLLNRTIGESDYGYIQTPTIGTRKNRLAQEMPALLHPAKKLDRGLWVPLFLVNQLWTYGLQGTGDCVSWGAAHVIDVFSAVLSVRSKTPLLTSSVASESIYGFGKSELFRSYNRHYPGMSGVDAIQACEKFGFLTRYRYMHDDLSIYSGPRAQAWGERPRATHGVPDYLEPIAKQTLTGTWTQVTTIAEAEAAITTGMPILYCGSVRWATQRDHQGFACKYRYGMHAMTLTGIRYWRDYVSGFWIANTGHGAHCTGPIGPIPMPPAYAACGGWMHRDEVESVLQQGDSWAITDLRLA